MTRALIIVDVQRDFLPGGALGVANGDAIIPEIEKLALEGDFDLIVVTGDEHPPQTHHFTRWPVHCVKGTPGAEIDFRVDAFADYEIVKGQGTDDDGYSAFEGVEVRDGVTLDALLRDKGVTEVTVVGLALDYCVKATALDAAKLGYGVTVPLEATRPVSSHSALKAMEELRVRGVTLLARTVRM